MDVERVDGGAHVATNAQGEEVAARIKVRSLRDPALKPTMLKLARKNKRAMQEESAYRLKDVEQAEEALRNLVQKHLIVGAEGFLDGETLEEIPFGPDLTQAISKHSFLVDQVNEFANDIKNFAADEDEEPLGK